MLHVQNCTERDNGLCLYLASQNQLRCSFSLVPSLTETLCTCNPPASPHLPCRFQHFPTFLHDVATDSKPSVLLRSEYCRDGSRCIGALLSLKHLLGDVWRCSAHISVLIPFSARAGQHVCPCIRGAAPKSCSQQNSRSRAIGFTVRGRGVSVQAAGYLIVLVLPLLRPFPSALPSSSQRQWEVSRGWAGPSLYHYSSITCHPPTRCWQQNFPPCPFSLRSHHRLRPFMISNLLSCLPPLWFSHLFTLHLFPHLTPWFVFLFFLFSLSFSCVELRTAIFFQSNVGFCHFETFCWDFGWSLDHSRGAAHPPLPLQTDSFHTNYSVDFWPEGGLNVCQKCSVNLGHTAMQYRCNVTMNIPWCTTVYSRLAEYQELA